MIAPRTLFAKLLLLFLAFGALMAGVLIYVMSVSHASYHLELDQLRNRALAQQYVAAHLLVREPPLSVHNFSSSLRHITEINPNIDVYVLDATGRVLASSAGEEHLALHRVDLAPVRQFVTGQAAFPLLGEDPADAHRHGVFSAAPLSIPGCSAAYLYILLTHHDGTSAIQRLKAINTLGTDAGFILAAVLAALAGSILFLRHLTRRLRVLQQDIEGFHATGAASVIPGEDSAHGSGDEIERLRGLFLQLAARVRDQMQELKDTDHLRRELLANISHDLRTPLATCQAHLETLVLKESLPSEERSAYLGIALQQCRRLVNLVDQLLMLAKFDAREITIAPEPFQLAELVQDVSMKWGLAARRADVTLTTEPPVAVLPLAFADIRWIERVLDTLLDNAIRHAGSGGRVTLSTTPTAHGVRVAVHDSGPGIPQSEQARIFDRLYRGDPSRSSESGRVGLGLSIARAILDLHGQRIDFATTAHEGTTFFFELPRTASTEPPQELGQESRRRGAAAT